MLGGVVLIDRHARLAQTIGSCVIVCSMAIDIQPHAGDLPDRLCQRDTDLPGIFDLAAGHAANSAFWLDDKTGNWITSSYYTDEIPKWVKEFNNKDFAKLYTEKEWTTSLPIDQYKEVLPDKNSFEVGFERSGTSFPYNIKAIKEKTQSFKVLKHIPAGNTLTTDFAIHAILNENMGKDDDPDLITINY